MPAQVVPAPLQAGCGARGVPLTATQVPLLPVSAQASQGPVHELEQHTPSTQLPLRQTDALVQAVPDATFGAQVLPAQ